MPADFATVEDRSFVISNFRLQDEIDSELGHSASGPEHAKWSPVLREFLEPLMAKLG
jgi:hypothetical protein